MKRIAIFFGSLAVCAGIAWLGGYNFDTRNPAIALFAIFSLVVSRLAVIKPGDE